MDSLLKNIKELISYVDEKAAINEDQRRIRFVISSDKIDRDNEKIEVAAVAAAIPAFSKNPVALSAHAHRTDSGKPSVIGSWDTDSFKANAHTSEMDLIFATTELGQEYFQLYKDKHMRAVSIGFRPIEYHEETDQKIGRVIIFTKIELYEISACAVGANREALSKIKSILDGKTAHTPETKNTLLQVMCEIMHEDMNNLGLLFNQLKAAMGKDFNEIKEQVVSLRNDLEELKDLLSDSDGFAKSLMLNSDNESSVPAENKDGHELLNKLLKTIIEHKES